VSEIKKWIFGVRVVREMEKNLREPAVGTADCDVEDEIEGLVERSVFTTCAAPWINGDGAVDGLAGKFTVGPEILVLGEVKELHLLQRVSIINKIL
jgi:hypothetical protein